MSIFHRKTLLESGVFQGYADCHSHILPAVDDGIRTLEDSLSALDYFESIGFDELWCTPHIMEDMPNRTEDLRRSFEELVSAYSGGMRLCLAAEYMMDNALFDRLEKDDLLPYGPEGDSLLVETSFVNPPFNMDGLLDKVRSCGLFPVLAHPERYLYMGKDRILELADSGVKFQMNIVSLTGCYGDFVRDRAEWMYKKKLYSYSGTDIHSLRVTRERFEKKIRIELCR